MNVAFVFTKFVFAREWIASTAVATSNVAWERVALQMDCFDVTLEFVVSVEEFVRGTAGNATLQDFRVLATLRDGMHIWAENEMLWSRYVA